MSSAGHEWVPHEREGWSVCSRCGVVRNYYRETTCSGALPKIRQRGEIEAFLRRTAIAGGSIVSSAAMTSQQLAIARAAGRMLVMPDGYGFVYVPGPRFCACGRPDSDCDQSRASCPRTDNTSEDDESGSG